MIRAVIFDLDGTMVDTEKLWGDVMHRLAPRYGTEFDPAAHIKMMGKRDRESLQAFKEHHGVEASVEDMVQARRKIILEDTGLIRTNKGLYELLDLLEKLKIQKAVATSAFEAFADKVLTQFDLKRRFGAIVTAGQVTHGKPHPEIYLEAAKRLGVKASDCLALEDAEIGVESAYNAGMKVFAIPHDSSRHHDFSKATKVISSMAEIDEKLLHSV